jgi:hypothetical protein
MKWLKLFENFQLDDYDNKMDLEDAKWIVITHLGEINELELPNEYESTPIKDVIYLEVSNPTNENIKKCESHLSAEGFFIFVNNNKFIVGFGDKSSFILNWLTTNFGKNKLKIIKVGNRVHYSDENGNQLLSHTKFLDRDDTKEIIISDIIWEFFIKLLHMKINEIEPILNGWLEKEWGLVDCKAFF